MTQVQVAEFLKTISIPNSELKLFDRLLRSDISQEHINSIESSGYVIHTLEASIWCLLTTDTYQEAILKAVNLGEDADTTAAVTGALAGLLYGFETIPDSWLNQLAKREEIEDLAVRLALKICPRKTSSYSE